MKKFIAKSFVIIFALLSSVTSFAQGDIGDPADTNPLDEPAAPIGDYIWVLGLLALVYVFFKIKNRIQSSSN